jgi:acylphosphatase
MKCVRCVVSGRVQGVFFRRSAQVKAIELEVLGWARNLPNGGVEVLVCGEASAVEAMRIWLWRGPPYARVEDVTWEEVAVPDDLDGFEVR